MIKTRKTRITPAQRMGRPKSIEERFETLAVTMPPEMKEKLINDAHDNRVSLSAYVRRIVEEHYQ